MNNTFKNKNVILLIFFPELSSVPSVMIQYITVQHDQKYLQSQHEIIMFLNQ